MIGCLASNSSFEITRSLLCDIARTLPFDVIIDDGETAIAEDAKNITRRSMENTSRTPTSTTPDLRAGGEGGVFTPSPTNHHGGLYPSVGGDAGDPYASRGD